VGNEATGGAVRDEGRRRGAGGECGQQRVVRAVRARAREHGSLGHERGPVREELVAQVRDELLLKPDDGVRLAQASRGLERVEAGIGERADDPDLLDGRAVDFLDLVHHELEQSESRQRDRELVDRDVGAAFEHVDTDDVAADRADPRRHEPERARSVRKPHPHENVRGLVGVAAASGRIESHARKRRSVACSRVSTR
jgi:hypothetical protein